MAQSLSLLYVHVVFHIGNPNKKIRLTDAPKLYNYIGGIIKSKDCIPISIAGMPDHIHILCILSKNISLAVLIWEIKRGSTLWLKEKESHYRDFRWQRGYGAFSVGVSSFEKTIRYIENQTIHHQKRNFR